MTEFLGRRPNQNFDDDIYNSISEQTNWSLDEEADESASLPGKCHDGPQCDEER